MIRAWLRGKSEEAPYWVEVLIAAETWHQPPWVIEEQATEEWWERWRCLEQEKARLPKPKAGK